MFYRVYLTIYTQDYRAIESTTYFDFPTQESADRFMTYAVAERDSGAMEILDPSTFSPRRIYWFTLSLQEVES